MTATIQPPTELQQINRAELVAAIGVLEVALHQIRKAAGLRLDTPLINREAMAEFYGECAQDDCNDEEED